MARLSFPWLNGRSKVGGLYVAVALAVFAAVVFLLFRGHSGGPREAAAGVGNRGASSAADPVEHAQGTVAPVLPGPSSDTPAAAPVQPQPAFLPIPGIQNELPTESLPDPQVAAILDEALALKRSEPGRLIEVRNRLNGALKMKMSPQQRQAIENELARLADDWLFGPAAFPGDALCEAYTVKRGDLLQVIGRRHKVPYEILMQINNISRPESLQADRSIKIVNGPFHAKVSRSAFTLDLYLQDVYVRSFKVGLGKPGYETPTGLWRVQEGGKLVKPPWTDPDTGRLYTASDPDYPLGSRWIALDGIEGNARGRTGFAIHGTKEPEQIGTAGSRGCIRMVNGDAVLMYNLLVPTYSQVEVFD
jgi:hypothetical protein